MLKYIVRLNSEEHAQLLALVNTGRAAAVTRLHARILLKADVGADRRCWTDAEIADALDTSAATVHRVRQGFVEKSNVNSVLEMSRLIEVNRTYSHIATLLQQQHDLHRSAIDKLAEVPA